MSEIRPPEPPEPPEPSTEAASCPDCGGRGWVVEADGGAGRARRCACRGHDRTPRLWAAAGVPPRYAHCRLSNFSLDHQEGMVYDQLRAALETCTAYVESFLKTDGSGFSDIGLVLVGRAGVGKTHLAVSVLRELIGSYKVRGRFVDFTELIHRLQSTFDPGSPGSTTGILDPILKAEVLVIDELGSQRPTPWVREVLYRLINTRYAERRPTLMTTNYQLREPDPKEVSLDRAADQPSGRELEPLAHRLPAALVSRLFEMARIVELDAACDFRREVRGHRLSRLR